MSGVSAYSPPPQREVPARIFTTAGWLRGAFQLPALRVFTDYINHPHGFLKLKSVFLPGLENEIPFFALQRESVILILFEPDEAIRPTEGKRRPADVSCAFIGGVISGTLSLQQGVRVSDFLIQKQQFFHLTSCSLYLRSGGKTETLHDLPIGIVNSRRVIGVSEPRFV